MAPLLNKLRILYTISGYINSNEKLFNNEISSEVEETLHQSMFFLFVGNL
jgi:hypothetical protein